ncbi:hypothetical protein RM577_03475 [Mammaliicoccus sciuri]|uniref:hypothetical protein n=1 Tax=Mammaliicoccus sciuri TaxID=1296 RepID=UPI00288521E6|nr:hypothetical protein [Mammaliicoccus sciuri]MDT0707349.1 hypothetical protein [Mammaliicoccus sciuri]
MYTPTEVRQMISDYKWMKNIIDSQVYECDSTSIGQYGIESSMPKAQGTTGDKVLVRVLRNDRDYRKTQSLVDKINFIDKNEEHIKNEKNYHILQLLKQGEKHNRIMVIMNVRSKENFYSRIDDIVDSIIAAQTNGTNETNQTNDVKHIN